MRSIIKAIREIFTTVKAAVKKALFTVLRGIKSLFNRFVTPIFRACYKYILLPLGKVVFLFGKYTFYVPLRSIGRLIYKLYYHCIKRPVVYIKNKFVHFSKVIYYYTIYKLFLLIRSIYRPVRRVTSLLIVKTTDFLYLFYHYTLYQILRFIRFSFKGLFHIFKEFFILCFKYFFYPIGRFFQWVYHGITRFFSFIFRKVIDFFTHYIFLPLWRMFKAIGKFIYRYFLNPITRFFRSLLDILLDVMDILIDVFQKIGKGLLKLFKLLYESVAVVITVVFSSIFFFLYSIIWYPFRILFKENRNVKRNKEIDSTTKILLNPYYIYQEIMKKNHEQFERIKETKEDLCSFVKIKNIVCIVPTFLWVLILYPLNFFLVFI